MFLTFNSLLRAKRCNKYIGELIGTRTSNIHPARASTAVSAPEASGRPQHVPWEWSPAHLGSWEVPPILQQVQMGWLEPRGWGTPAAIWSYPSLHFEVLGCCKMQKELLGNVVSIKINALTRSQIATANVLLNEI